MDIVSFAQQHPVWTIFALIAAIVLVGWSFAWAAGNELKEEAERVHFPKNRRLTPETLELYEAEHPCEQPASSPPPAQTSLRERLFEAWAAVVMLLVFFLFETAMWMFTVVPRFCCGACDDPDCDGYLGHTASLTVTETGYESQRRCVVCGMPHVDTVSFAEAQYLNHFMSNPFS